jgi:hypothetical protein
MTPPTLTLSFRRAEVTGFWIVAVAAAIATAALIARALDASMLWATSGVLILAPRVVSRYWFAFGIVAWNRLVSSSLPPLRSYVLKVCYYVMFGVMRFAGSSLEQPFAYREAPAASRWLRRGENLRPGRWTVWLQPVLVLLTVLGDQRPQSGPPSGTYTLY